MNDKQRPETVVGKRVRRLRQERGWSQEDLAQRMVDEGLSWRQTTVAKTEGASRPLRVDELAALGRALEVTVPDLLNPTLTTTEEKLQLDLVTVQERVAATEIVMRRLEEAIAKNTDELREKRRTKDALETEAAKLSERLSKYRATLRASIARNAK